MSAKSTKAPKRRRAASLEKRKARGGYIFVLPFILGLLIVYLPVIIDSFKSTFITVKDIAGTKMESFAGFANYQEALFSTPAFVQTLKNGVLSLLVDIPSIVIFSLFIAVILNQKVLGRAVFRAIFFIPVICATGLMETIDSAASSYNDYMGNQGEGINMGMVETEGSGMFSGDSIIGLFESMKIGTELAEFVVSAVNRVSSIIDRCGVQMLILLAALQSISPAIYESCSIDGATTWETFWKITLPMISPMILVSAVYTVIDAFTSHNSAIMKFITGQVSANAQVGTAMAWVYFGVIILLVLVVVLVLRTYVFYQRRDA
jgi:ABC-type sugar transport system permease subunit